MYTIMIVCYSVLVVTLQPEFCGKVTEVVILLLKTYVYQSLMFVLNKYCLFINRTPESRACPRATHQGCAKSGATSPCKRYWHRKKFQRKTDKKKWSKSFCFKQFACPWLFNEFPNSRNIWTIKRKEDNSLKCEIKVSERQQSKL